MPILRPREYRNLQGASAIAQLEVPSGILRVGDDMLDKCYNDSEVFELSVEPGRYNVCAFYCVSRGDFGSDKIIIVAVAAKEELPNDFKEIPSFS